MTQVQSIATPITWRGFTFPPEATVRFVDAVGQLLEAPAALALSSGLLDTPSTNPNRAVFLRDWARDLPHQETHHG